MTVSVGVVISMVVRLFIGLLVYVWGLDALRLKVSSSCISRLLPPLRDSIITSRLRTLSLYPQPATRTKRYQ